MTTRRAPRPGRLKIPLRTLARSAVLITWVAVMVALVVRSRTVREPLTPSRPLPHEGSEQWQGIYGEGKKIGYSHRVRKPTADGFSVESNAQMQLSMMGTAQLVRTSLEAETDRSLRLRRFVFHLRSGTVDFTLRGTARGDELVLTSDSLGARTVRLPISTRIALSETLADLIGEERLETGRTLRYALFDPLGNEPAPVSLAVGPIERITLPAGARSAYRVDEEYQGTHFRLWIDANGEVLKEEGPLGMTIVREKDARAAMSGIESGDRIDLGAAAAITVARPIASPRNARRLRLRVDAAPAPDALSFPPRQRLEDQVLVIAREDEGALRSYTLPARDPEHADELRPTAFFQSDDPAIRQLAAEIVGTDSDAVRSARRILDWVYTNLAKVPTLSVPNAVEVLAERKGDCNEHAVLYAALARAAGLPTRMVAGVVYMPGEGKTPAAFYYHAWNEVWLGAWTAVDPTFGQFPADATHVELVEGGPDKDLTLIRTLGQLRFDVEDAG
ncbi:MAG TPA: transglutaminase-like domain-containing protein [Candidatus Binatia bacterium]|nr:transglutaminase-like domain-containing protein [Candidatus Binatia bacterium]